MHKTKEQEKDGGELIRTCRRLVNEKKRIHAEIISIKYSLHQKFYIQPSIHQREVFQSLNLLLFQDHPFFKDDYDSSTQKAPTCRDDVVQFMLKPYAQNVCRASLETLYTTCLMEMEEKGIIGIKPSTGLYTFTDLYVLFMKL